jgi:hypothetical protein
MLGCGDPSQGFSSYICLNCGEQRSVPFSCKCTDRSLWHCN